VVDGPAAKGSAGASPKRRLCISLWNRAFRMPPQPTHTGYVHPGQHEARRANVGLRKPPTSRSMNVNQPTLFPTEPYDIREVIAPIDHLTRVTIIIDLPAEIGRAA
jgi:hypothetical protein